MAYLQGEDRKQITLFPESIDEYITEDSVVRIIDEYVDQLDVRKLGFKFAECPTVGRPPYDPRDMIKLYVYGYLARGKGLPSGQPFPRGRTQCHQAMLT